VKTHVILEDKVVVICHVTNNATIILMYYVLWAEQYGLKATHRWNKNTIEAPYLCASSTTHSRKNQPSVYKQIFSNSCRNCRPEASYSECFCTPFLKSGSDAVVQRRFFLCSMKIHNIIRKRTQLLAVMLWDSLNRRHFDLGGTLRTFLQSVMIGYISTNDLLLLAINMTKQHELS
jgi:hypothetical protein